MNDIYNNRKVSLSKYEVDIQMMEPFTRNVVKTLAILREITQSFKHFTVPSIVFSNDGEIIKVIGISHEIEKNGEINIISFVETSEVDEIPMDFIFSCRVKFILPSTAKRVSGCYFNKENKPAVLLNGENRFVSVTWKRNITNLHPLEIVRHEFHRTNIFIKETTRVIGSYAYYLNYSVRTVAFPPSIEVIEDSSFYGCSELTRITFKGNSKLRKIGKDAFTYASIEEIDFPPSLEEIGEGSFLGCIELISVNFPSNRNLMKINRSEKIPWTVF